MEGFPKKSDVLKEARSILWDGEAETYVGYEMFLCLAVERVLYLRSLSVEQFDDFVCDHYRDLFTNIANKIEGCITVEVYLHRYPTEGYNRYDKVDVQRFRLHILNTLIQEYEEKGE